MHDQLGLAKQPNKPLMGLAGWGWAWGGGTRTLHLEPSELAEKGSAAARTTGVASGHASALTRPPRSRMHQRPTPWAACLQQQLRGTEQQGRVRSCSAYAAPCPQRAAEQAFAQHMAPRIQWKQSVAFMNRVRWAVTMAARTCQ